MMSPKFEQTIWKLRGHPFDIEFSNGRRFDGVTVVSSETNLLLRTSDNRLIRMPSDCWVQKTLPSYVKGHRVLEIAGVPVPRAFHEESDPREYLLQEFLPVQFTCATIPAILPRQQRDHLYDKLVEFMATTWQFRAIGDFGENQIGWTGDRWVLLDMTSAHVPLRREDPVTTYHAVSSTQSPLRLFRLPTDVMRRIDKAVAERRTRALTVEHAPLISAQEHGLPTEIESY